MSSATSPSTGRRKTTTEECRTVVLVFQLPVLLLQVLPDGLLGLAEVPLQLLDGLVRTLKLSLLVGDQLVRRRTVGALIVVRLLVAVVLLDIGHCSQWRAGQECAAVSFDGKFADLSPRLHCSWQRAFTAYS